MKALVGKERKCYVCKKPFIITDQWVFRKTYGSHERVYCSWKCMRSHEKERMTKAERRDAIQNSLLTGRGVKETAEKLGEDPTKVYYWAKKLGVKP